MRPYFFIKCMKKREAIIWASIRVLPKLNLYTESTALLKNVMLMEMAPAERRCETKTEQGLIKKKEGENQA